jgi:hypothetical protein
MKHGPDKIELHAADLIVGKPAKRRKRPATIAGTLAQARKAGEPVKAATIAPDGSITIVLGQPGASDFNEWDQELLDGKH